MEESKELQGFYKIFRTVVYVSVLLEFFEYAIDPAMLDHWGGILTDIHGLSVWLFGHTMETRLYTLPLNIILYMIASIAGVVLVHIALDNISKFIKEGLMKDRFNFENESFEQCEEKVENEYSVNIPMRYYYKGKFRKGWISVSNCFRGTWVVGTPGSGKTFSIIEPFIRQHSAKGFAMVVYDYKFPTSSTTITRRTRNWAEYPKGASST